MANTFLVIALFDNRLGEFFFVAKIQRKDRKVNLFSWYKNDMQYLWRNKYRNYKF
jgi:hypothetical protein